MSWLRCINASKKSSLDKISLSLSLSLSHSLSLSLFRMHLMCFCQTFASLCYIPLECSLAFYTYTCTCSFIPSQHRVPSLHSPLHDLFLLSIVFLHCIHPSMNYSSHSFFLSVLPLLIIPSVSPNVCSSWLEFTFVFHLTLYPPELQVFPPSPRRPPPPTPQQKSKPHPRPILRSSITRGEKPGAQRAGGEIRGTRSRA